MRDAPELEKTQKERLVREKTGRYTEVMSFLELEEVSVHFPVKNAWGKTQHVVKAVDGVSLSIERGEVLGLVGESGCGKTTLSRAVMQLQSVTGGRIVLDGEELTALSASEVRRRRLNFQMIFQDPYSSLNPRYSIGDMLAEALSRRVPMAAKGRQDAVAELMQRVGLDPAWMHKYPHEFSGGQRQRAAIARAIAPQPALVLADEPVSALDVSIQSQILNLLNDLRRTMGLTMLFISHDLSVVRYMADRIAVMKDGRIVEYGEAEEVFGHPRHEYTRRLLDAVPHL